MIKFDLPTHYVVERTSECLDKSLLLNPGVDCIRVVMDYIGSLLGYEVLIDSTHTRYYVVVEDYSELVILKLKTT